MSEQAKHTAGPWEALIEKKSKYFPQGSAMVRTSEGRLAIDCNDSGDTQEASAANARLIAASPDLLAATQMLLDVLDELSGECDAVGEFQAPIRMARAAIAKAIGQ